MRVSNQVSNQVTSAIAIVAMSLGSISAVQAASVKPGGPCVKVGSTAIAKAKKFTCIRSKGKLVWNKGVPISPDPTYPASSAFKASSSYSASNRTSTMAKDTVTDTIEVSANQEVVDLKSFFVSPSGVIVFYGKATLIFGNKLKFGRWQIIFEVPTELAAGTYVRKYFAVSKSGKEAFLLDFPI